MKKTLLVTVALFVAMLCAGRAYALGTASDWSVKLSFKTDSKTDVYPIVIGQGQTADELLKPPPLPGYSVTQSLDDAIVNAYVVSASAARQAAKIIEVPVTNSPGEVWPVEVYFEQAGPVKLDVDLSNFYNVYKLTVINPETGEFKVFDNANKSQTLFTATTAGTKTLYVMAGKSASFAATSPNGAFGAVQGVSMGALAGAEVFVNGSKVATTGAGGSFNAGALANGTYTVRVTKQYFLGMEGTLTVEGGSGTLVLNDLYAGDFNSDGKIELSDFMIMKKSYKKSTGQDGFNAICDLDGNGIVEFADVAKVKPGYKKSVSWLGH
jgi:hypothetical protein